MTALHDLDLTLIPDLLGTFAFAVSGIKFASGKKIDWFGAYIIGLVTAIGGGTTRDLFLGVSPFWLSDARYLIATGAALLAAIVFKEKLFRLGNALFIFDTIGLGLFTIAGITKSLDAGLSFWACILMGTITGTVGGILRDVLINEVPLLFRKDIYALACVAGGIVYFIGYKTGTPDFITEGISALTIILIRIIAVRFHLHLPILSSIGEKQQDGRK